MLSGNTTTNRRSPDMRISTRAPGRRSSLACGAFLLLAGLVLAVGAGYAQEDENLPQWQKDQKSLQKCAAALGWAACTGGAHGPVPEARNDLWNAIAFSPSLNVAAFAGSFTAPENARAAALKRCASRASDCKIVVAAHDMCLAVAFERKGGGLYRAAAGTTKLDAENKVMPVCAAEGPQRCSVLASCSGQPPILLLSR
jgi:hypothetical protein